MARFLGLKCDAGSSSWSIIARDRSAEALADKVALWMVDNPPTFPPSTIGFARVPPGVDVEQFVLSLPPPDVSDCPLCRAGGLHTVH